MLSRSLVQALTVIAVFGLVLSNSTGECASADAILKSVDDVRSPNGSYLMKIAVSDSTDASRYEFETSIKGRDKTLIRTTLPKREEGKTLLMLGDDMWVAIPGVKRAVRVSLSQKLVGEAANGDLARMKWWNDYDVTILSETEQVWTLGLTARRKNLTYNRIQLQVEKKDTRPIEAEFLTSGGKVLKKVRYRSYKKMAGRLRPTEMEITNSTTGEKSVISILSIQIKALSDSIFNQNNLQ